MIRRLLGLLLLKMKLVIASAIGALIKRPLDRHLLRIAWPGR